MFNAARIPLNAKTTSHMGTEQGELELHGRWTCKLFLLRVRYCAISLSYAAITIIRLQRQFFVSVYRIIWLQCCRNVALALRGEPDATLFKSKASKALVHRGKALMRKRC